MNFKEFEIRHVKLPLKEPFETSFGKIKNRNIVVLVGKKNGIKFFGEASAQFAPLYNHETAESDFQFIKKFVIPALRKADSIEEYNELVSRYKGNPMAKSAGEFLLYHHKSLENDKSLKELIGGQKDTAECGVSIGLQDTPEELVEEVRKYRKRGYNRAKIKNTLGKCEKNSQSIR